MSSYVEDPDELEIGKLYQLHIKGGEWICGVLPGGFISCPSPSLGYVPFSVWRPKEEPKRNFIYHIQPMDIVMYIGRKHGISFLQAQHEHYKFLHNNKIVYISRTYATRYLYCRCM